MKEFTPLNKRWVTRTAIVAAFLLSGCGGATPSKRSSQSELPPPAGQHIDPLTRSLDSFRKDVQRHRARILMGTCVGWPDEGQGLAITLNPGIVTYGDKGSKHKQQYFVFSATDQASSTPSLIQMNGPNVGNPEAALQVDPSERPSGGFERKLTHTIFHDPNGQFYYEDAATGQPVMDTALVSGPPSLEYLGAVCSALRDHQPIPSYNT